MPHRHHSDPGDAATGAGPTSSGPARSDIGENTASELIEAPQKPAGKGKRDPLVAHDFPDGGGGGGAERFSRRRVKGEGR
jgi:hypothetical protein